LAGIVALIMLIFALRNLVELLSSTNRTMLEAEKAIVEMRVAVTPILAKVDTGMEALNVQLERLDTILSDFEFTSQKVAHTAEAASGIVQTPVDFVATVTDRVMRGWKERRAQSEDAR
ncbi:MAG: hypothetical protein FWD93_03300, partial [Coriobacteriia bacterium]|nr:hypothetical protein [Coriobacteriia bacterium]